MKKTSLITTALLLSACGFHLKGLNTAAPSIDRITVIASEPESLSYRTLLNTLHESHIATDSLDSPWKASLSSISYNRRQTASGSSNSTREIELTESYRITLLCRGESIESTDISNRTSVEYNSAEYLGSQSEELNARAQLARENADAALRFINAITQSRSCQ